MGTYLNLLGPVAVTREEGAGLAPRFRSRRTIALLGYLATERRPHAREQLACFFWPDDPPAKGRSNLRRELYNLAQMLPDCWQADAQSVTFVPSAETKVDIDILEQLARAKQWQAAADLLSGEFLEGLYLEDNLAYENWLLGERAQWRERSQAFLLGAAGEMICRGRYADALPYARRLVRLTPWDENAHRYVMRLLAWDGRRSEALRQYALCRQALADELGVEPSTETETLYRQIQAGELAKPPIPPAFLAEDSADQHGTRSLFVLRDRELAWLDARLAGALNGEGSVAFVTGGPGRGKTALLEAFAAKALAERPQLLIAGGNCTAYTGAGDPYLPFRDIIAMLSGDVEGRWAAGSISTIHARRLWGALPIVTQAILENGPRLLDVFLPSAALLARGSAAEPAGAPWLDQLADLVQHGSGEPRGVEQIALFEQFQNVLRAVAAQRPILLLLDDIQWMDAASTGLLFHLARRIADGRSRILILCTYRPEEVIRGQSGVQRQLAQVLSELRRMFGDAWLGLDWSGEDEGRQFVNSVLDSEPNDLSQAFREALFQRTDGHPLFTVELLRAMRDRGHLIQDEDGQWREGPRLDWTLMPARIEAVIEARVQQLALRDQDLLAAASVEGELFTVQVLAQVQNLEVGALLRLLSRELDGRHRLVQEQETFGHNIARFRFRHVLFQEYLYRHLSYAERQLLHGAVAAALETVYANDLETLSVQLAQHYDQAGEVDRALHYFTLAADHAARIHAYEEAIAHYTRALSLTRRGTTSKADLASLYYRRSLAYETTGQFELARSDLETALNLSRETNEPQMMWHVLIELGKLWSSRDYNRTRDYIARSLELARRLDDPVMLARSLNRLGNWHANNEEPGQALAFHKEALRIFGALDDRPNYADTLDLMGIAQLLSGNYAAGATSYDQAIELFREFADYPRLVSSLIPRALAATGPLLLAAAPLLPGHDPFADVAEALKIARQIGSIPDEAWGSWALAMLHTLRGDFGRAVAAGRNGLRLATEIQHREWQVGNRYALGVAYNELLHPQMALQELEPALLLARELQSRYWVNHVSGTLVQSYILLGDLGEALHGLDGVLSAATPMDTAGKRYCWARRAELALAMDEPDLALNIAERLIRSAAGLRPGDVLTFLWLVKGQALARIGQLDEARDLLVHGRDHAQAAQERFLLWRFHATLASLFQEAGEKQAAEEEAAALSLTVDEMAATVTGEDLATSYRSRALAMLGE